MKTLKHFFFFLLLAPLFVACGGDDDDDQGGSNKPPQPPKTEVNVNKNNAQSQPVLSRLEFPKVKGGSSRVLVYSTADRFGVNYCVEWDASLKTQRWSCYIMTTGYKGNAGRYSPTDGSRQYPWDPNLPVADRWEQDDFVQSGFDHGHICPSADRQYSTEANKQTFYMTNMQPQYGKFNQKIWAEMEGMVRSWTPKGAADTLFVCKGGTVDKESQIIKRLNNRMIVPKYFYMALLLKSKTSSGFSYRAMAFWIENENKDLTATDEYKQQGKSAFLKQYVITIDDLEQRTGIDFFCNLADEKENSVENSVNTAAWGFK